MKSNNNKEVSRRNFLKTLGVGSVATAAAMYGCKPDNTSHPPLPSLDELGAATSPPSGGGLGGAMTYRTNPHTGDKVSLLGYGCMRLPMRANEEIDQDAVNEQIDYAIAHGVNYFDTSPRYMRGLSEKSTGIALSRHPRDKYFIATKMSNQADDKYLRSREGSIALYHKSMAELQVDYLDYYLLHGIGNGGMEDFKERFLDNGILDFLLKERQSGRIRNLGWSYHGDVAVFDHLLSLDIQWDFAMIQLNYVDWQHASSRNTNAEYLLGELEKRNVPAVVMEPLLGGRLARLNTRALKILKTIHPEDSAAKWAFRYAGTPASILTVLSGMTYIEHLQENVRTYSHFKPLNEQEYEALEKVTKIILDGDEIPCTECQYCMPCPYGIDIPEIFMHYNRIVNAGEKLQSSNDEDYRKARRAFLVGYDRSVPKLRQADHCIECNICNPRCPQRIDIPKEMQRIDAYTETLKRGDVF